MVVHTTEYGVLAWPGELITRRGNSWLCLKSGATMPEFLHVSDLDQVLCFEWMAVTGHEASVVFGAEARDLGLAGFGALLTNESPVALQAYAARAAFAGLTVPLMLRLIDMNGWHPHPKPKTEREVVKYLLSKMLPHLSEEEAKQIYETRGKEPLPRSFKKATSPEMDEIVEEVINDADMTLVRKDDDDGAPRKQMKPEGAAKPQPRPEAASSSRDVPDVASSSRDVPVVAGPAAPIARPLRPIVGEEFTVGQAKAWLPPAQGCSVAIHTQRAWMVKYLGRRTPGPRSHTITWRPPITHRAALLRCLQWAWQRHEECDGASCPWDLSE